MNFALWSDPAKRAQNAPRAYAVGDVHGRADLLEVLIARIGEDRADDTAPTPLVFLGDYVDRGLHSRETLDRLIALESDGRFATRFLKGNHEAAMLDFLVRPEGGASWLAFGGAETLYSYGVKAPSPGAAPETLHRTAEALRARVPEAHIAFLNRLELFVRWGDYLFVHAGLRPGRTLEEQEEQDMLTIRDAFMKSRKKWPFIVVHGHTPGDAVHIDGRRICVDTGAYVTGKLSAVRLQGGAVQVLST